jgi:hypothetical protein|tara:strand:- start:42 stop:362 length:321 start_codon:yes stop_codon:yes gene_type:complete
MKKITKNSLQKLISETLMELQGSFPAGGPRGGEGQDMGDWREDEEGDMEDEMEADVGLSKEESNIVLGLIETSLDMVEDVGIKATLEIVHAKVMKAGHEAGFRTQK